MAPSAIGTLTGEFPWARACRLMPSSLARSHASSASADVAVDDVQHIVEVVSQAAGQQADRFQAADPVNLVA